MVSTFFAEVSTFFAEVSTFLEEVSTFLAEVSTFFAEVSTIDLLFSFELFLTRESLFVLTLISSFSLVYIYKFNT